MKSNKVFIIKSVYSMLLGCFFLHKCFFIMCGFCMCEVDKVTAKSRAFLSAATSTVSFSLNNIFSSDYSFSSCIVFFSVFFLVQC